MTGAAAHESENIIKLEQVWLDPVLTGFAGVILELSEREGLFTLVEIAAGSGNKILQVSSPREHFIRGLFEKEFAGYTGLQHLFY